MAVSPERNAILLEFFAPFIGAFAKLRKTTHGFVITLRPSAWNSSARTGLFFMKCDTWMFFETIVIIV
jgi:hypothetical protein